MRTDHLNVRLRKPGSLQARGYGFSRPCRTAGGIGRLDPDAFMNPAIAQHHKLPARGNDEEKHAAAIFCARHAEPDERLLGSLVDVAPKQSCNGNPDLA